MQISHLGEAALDVVDMDLYVVLEEAGIKVYESYYVSVSQKIEFW